MSARLPVPSKLAPVASPPHAVPRRRLWQALDGPHQVVVVTAPAGYGKSTLVATWAASRPSMPIAWVALDEMDAGGPVFWDLIATSLAAVAPEVAEAADVLREPGRELASFLAVLEHTLRRPGRDVILVLEDFHRIAATEVGGDLARLVEHCPDLRLVVTSRHDANLPVARWVAERRAIELRAGDLAFDLEEAAQLLAPYPGASPTAVLDRLVGLTEGWAVGLLLGALAVENAADPAGVLDGALARDRHLVGYLTDELLQRLPTDVVDVLLDLSLVPWFDADLVEEIVDDPAALAAVARLVDANPFVVELGPGLYRFHHVLAAVAAAERRWRTPDRHDAVLQRAAAAFQRRGALDVTVDLLLRAGQIDEAVDVVIGSALAFNDEGRLREFRTWFRRLPTVAPADVRRAAAYSLAAVFADDLDLALRWAFRARDMADSPTDDGLVATTIAVALGAAGRPTEAAGLIEVMERAGPDSEQPMFIDGRMSSHAARLALQVGMVDRAGPFIDRIEARRGDPLGEVHGPAMRATWLLLQGNAVAAAPLARSAVEAAANRGMRPHPATTDADLADAEASLALFRLDRAARALERLGSDADVVSWPWYHLRRWPLAIWFRAIDDGWSAAHELAEGLGASGVPLVGDLRPAWHALMCRTLLGARRPADAAVHLEFVPAGPDRALLAARVAGQLGRTDDLEANVAGALVGRLPQRIEAHLVLAAHAGGDRSRRAFEQAVELARPGQWWLPFALDRSALTAVALRDGVLDAVPALGKVFGPASAEAMDRALQPIEPLSQRELEVLALLPSHLSYTEIGAQLYVSTNTIKTHVAAVYRKLDVSSRSEAVRAARLAGLLER